MAVVVLYDEGCGVCTALAGRLARGGRGLETHPIGSPVGERWLRDLAPAERYAGVHAIDSAGRRHTGAAAVPVILRAVPGGRGPAALAEAVWPLTRLGYALLARHRALVSRAMRLRACGASVGAAGARARQGRPARSCGGGRPATPAREPEGPATDRPRG